MPINRKTLRGTNLTTTAPTTLRGIGANKIDPSSGRINVGS